MVSEYRYESLPILGSPRRRNESTIERMNRQLSDLVAEGWEPISITGEAPTMMIGVMLKRVRA